MPLTLPVAFIRQMAVIHEKAPSNNNPPQFRGEGYNFGQTLHGVFDKRHSELQPLGLLQQRYWNQAVSPSFKGRFAIAVIHQQGFGAAFELGRHE